MRLCLLLILFLIIAAADAARLTVGTEGEDFSQIQQAIDNSSEGSVVEVHSGTYYENVHVFFPVTLLGVDSGRGKPLIDAGGAGSAMTLDANGTIVKGFNITGSGHCGCGNSGILVKSSNNLIEDNILYGNKYGIYIRPGNINNSFFSNDLQQNNITAYDPGGNRWGGQVVEGGIGGLVQRIMGVETRGNHYSDYDEQSEGCSDSDNNGICDLPRKIEGGGDTDNYSTVRSLNH